MRAPYWSTVPPSRSVLMAGWCLSFYQNINSESDLAQCVFQDMQLRSNGNGQVLATINHNQPRVTKKKRTTKGNVSEHKKKKKETH